jgi:hypothetical protein
MIVDQRRAIMTSTPSVERPGDNTPEAQPVKKPQTAPARTIQGLFLGSVSLLGLAAILGRFDTTTELVPTHEAIQEVSLIIGGFAGLLVCATAIYLTRMLSIIQRVMLPLGLMFVTAIGVFLVANRSASIVEGWVDFPKEKSHTIQALLRISRAYQTHGKGASQYIQTMPIWSNLEITREDFTLMQAHRSPDDAGKNPDEILSRGYFCAKVEIEQSGNALRILHSGSQKLPQGTVVPCAVQKLTR